MFNLFTLFLTVFTCFSGVCWCIHYCKKSGFISSYINDKLYQFSPMYVCDAFKRIKALIFFRKICYYCAHWIFDICVSIFPILFFVFIIRSFLFEPFQIPSGSMMPTLLSGDFILVNKFCYGIKNPITQSTLIEINHPKRGDIVVFKYPLNTKLDYVKRVVGLPGDRVIYNSFSKQLIIYPNCVSHVSDDNYSNNPISITYTDIFPSNFIQIFNIEHGEIITRFYNITSDMKVHNGIRLMQSKESFDGVAHDILTIISPDFYNFAFKLYNQGEIGDFLSEWIVPVGKYFMLGDNRDNSSDSRYWGFVPEKNIVGKAFMIWMSFDKKSDHFWPVIVRFHRIGKIC